MQCTRANGNRRRRCSSSSSSSGLGKRARERRRRLAGSRWRAFRGQNNCCRFERGREKKRAKIEGGIYIEGWNWIARSGYVGTIYWRGLWERKAGLIYALWRNWEEPSVAGGHKRGRTRYNIEWFIRMRLLDIIVFKVSSERFFYWMIVWSIYNAMSQWRMVSWL